MTARTATANHGCSESPPQRVGQTDTEAAPGRLRRRLRSSSPGASRLPVSPAAAPRGKITLVVGALGHSSGDASLPLRVGGRVEVV